MLRFVRASAGARRLERRGKLSRSGSHFSPSPKMEAREKVWAQGTVLQPPPDRGGLQFYGFWLISNANVVKDFIEGLVTRGVCILINNG